MSKLQKLMAELEILNRKRLNLYRKRRDAKNAQTRLRRESTSLSGHATREEWAAKQKAYNKERRKDKYKWTLEMEREFIQTRLDKAAKSKQVVNELKKLGMVLIWGTNNSIKGVQLITTRDKNRAYQRKRRKEYEDSLKKESMMKLLDKVDLT